MREELGLLEPRSGFATVEAALEDIRQGKFVVVVDDEDRENEGDLTIAALDDDGFGVALVPHTLEQTTLGTLAQGDEVNLEVDVLAKYVERLVGAGSRGGRG